MLTFPRRLRVLVVDDEPIVGDIVSRSLARSANVVVVMTFADGCREAVAGEFDAVVCDLNLPDGDALAFASFLGQRCPLLAGRLIVTTGGAFTAAHQRFLDSMEPRVLSKPFAAPTVRQLVASVAPHTPAASPDRRRVESTRPPSVP